MTDTVPLAPRTFVSYSWSSLNHQTWVLQLAARLVEDGVDVTLDKWDLKPGYDPYVFMEQMVVDKTVTKVVIVCDRAYTEKANSREGGVGVESQILTPELYRKASQDKYAAILTERDEDGKAYVPAFFGGRIYIDFTGADREEPAYEELLRWLLDKPQFVKPQLGKAPDFITKSTAVAPATTSRQRRAEEAIRNGTASAPAYMRDFADALLGELPKHAPSKDDATPWDETVMTAVERLRPYIRQVQELAGAVCRYSEDERVAGELTNLLERLAPLMFRPELVGGWTEGDFDTFLIVVGEIWHSVFAIALREGRFDIAGHMLDRSYYTRTSDVASGPEMSSFLVFRQFAKGFESRNLRLALNAWSLYADYLKDTYTNHTPNFQDMLQAEFVLYLRSERSVVKGWQKWWPASLIYAVRQFQPFEVFARSESTKYLKRLLPVLGSESAEEFRSFAAALESRDDQSMRLGGYSSLPIARLSNLENLGTKP